MFYPASTFGAARAGTGRKRKGRKAHQAGQKLQGPLYSAEDTFSWLDLSRRAATQGFAFDARSAGCKTAPTCLKSVRGHSPAVPGETLQGWRTQGLSFAPGRAHETGSPHWQQKLSPSDTSCAHTSPQLPSQSLQFPSRSLDICFQAAKYHSQQLLPPQQKA